MKAIFEPIFNAYVEAGRELTYREVVDRFNPQLKIIKKKYSKLTIRRILLLIRKDYASRWHEIYQPKPEIASESILERMRIAARKKV